MQFLKHYFCLCIVCIEKLHDISRPHLHVFDVFLGLRLCDAMAGLWSLTMMCRASYLFKPLYLQFEQYGSACCMKSSVHFCGFRRSF